MPLVFIVLVIIVLIVHFRDTARVDNRLNEVYAKSMRKTNVSLERKLLIRYLQLGMLHKDAVEQVKKDMISVGFEPVLDQFKGASTWHLGPWDDSDGVKAAQENAFRQKKNNSRDYYKVQQSVYKHYPNSREEAKNYYKRESLSYKVVPIGEKIYHPVYGTCKVIGHNYNTSKTKGTYVLESIMTGKVITSVKIGSGQGY